MCAKPDLCWADINLEWSKIPTKEVQDALHLLKHQCATLFEGRPDDPTIESAMRGRLYQARRNWQQKQRAKTREFDPFSLGAVAEESRRSIIVAHRG